jgi:hypothetical protein
VETTATKIGIMNNDNSQASGGIRQQAAIICALLYYRRARYGVISVLCRGSIGRKVWWTGQVLRRVWKRRAGSRTVGFFVLEGAGPTVDSENAWIVFGEG